MFSQLNNYSDAKTRELQCFYEAGKRHLTLGQYESAIEDFRKAGTYSDAPKKLLAAQTYQVKSLISERQYSKANDIVVAASKSGNPLGEFNILAVGDKGKDMTTLLGIAKGMGYIESYPKGETEYKAQYTNAVKKIETTLGLDADGVITLSEIDIISGLIYPTQDGTSINTKQKTKQLLEQLCDLGYISYLPEEHEKYDSWNYYNGIQNAEKAFGLHVDGLVTKEEYDTIMKQEVLVPPKPENVKAFVNNADVSLIWDEVSGAKYYNVYRGDELLTITKERWYIDHDVKTGKRYYYYIQACKYTCSSYKAVVSCNVEVFYKSPSIAELCNSVSKYKDDYVSLSYLTRAGQYMSGKDLYILCKAAYNGKTYYVYFLLENYYGWNWNDGKGIKDYSISSLGGKGKVSTIKDTKYDKGTIRLITLSDVSWQY